MSSPRRFSWSRGADLRSGHRAGNGRIQHVGLALHLVVCRHRPAYRLSTRCESRLALDHPVPPSTLVLVGGVRNSVCLRICDEQPERLLALFNVLDLEVARALPSDEQVCQKLTARDGAQHPPLEYHLVDQRAEAVLKSFRDAFLPLVRHYAIDKASDHQRHVCWVGAVSDSPGLPQGVLGNVCQDLSNILWGCPQREAGGTGHWLTSLVGLDLFLGERPSHQFAHKPIQCLLLLRIAQGHLVDIHVERLWPALDHPANVLRPRRWMEVVVNLPERGRVILSCPQHLYDLLLRWPVLLQRWHPRNGLRGGHRGARHLRLLSRLTGVLHDGAESLLIDAHLGGVEGGAERGAHGLVLLLRGPLRRQRNVGAWQRRSANRHA
mmetsp:Transcript_17004/g.34765  ORF Transcript_17004/g.34765 Transcript_17004/m.34765 type:complete len:380 (+) Transcript_17004:384-1523(+)